jgi:ABC-type multidrug transport system ATPase subunit
MSTTFFAATGLSKRFGSTLAVDQVSLSASPGQLIALLGPNGSGKTTLLRLLAGLTVPSAGQLVWGPAACSMARVPRASYVGREPALYDRLTPAEHLHYFARLGGMTRRSAARRAQALSDELGLGELITRRCGALSTGQRHRVDLARALVTEPALLLLDEPLQALDPSAALAVEQLLREQARGLTTVVATHALELAARLCDRALVLRAGRRVAEIELTASGSSLGQLAAQLRELLVDGEHGVGGAA